jgi:hypothetical protein
MKAFLKQWLLKSKVADAMFSLIALAWNGYLMIISGFVGFTSQVLFFPFSRHLLSTLLLIFVYLLFVAIGLLQIIACRLSSMSRSFGRDVQLDSNELSKR